MISYCIACYRPKYSRMLIDDLIRKTTAPYEILVWLNVDDPSFEKFLHARIAGGVPLRIVGATPENIGMRAYQQLFTQARYQMITQIDDDVIAVSKGIAEQAREIFQKYPRVKQLVADVWQDEYTNGARPALSEYTCYSQEDGLFDGPVDGWFSVFDRSVLPEALSYYSPLGRLCRQIRAILRGNLNHPGSSYFSLGGRLRRKIRARGELGLLCTKLKVFHVVGPAYASYFEMLDFEIEKYKRLGRSDLVHSLTDAKSKLPSEVDLKNRVEGILEHLAYWPQETGRNEEQANA